MNNGDRDYQTIPALMLKNTEYGSLLETPSNIVSIEQTSTLCDALEETVRLWEKGLDAFGMETHTKYAEEAYGAIVVIRMAFSDLAQPLPMVSRKEADELLKAIDEAFKPMVRSYSATPKLAKWYSSLPLKVAATYNKFRGQR